MAFTEFCCRNGGSNLNGGGLASGAEPSTSAVYTSTNGDWGNAAANKFTPSDGSTPASTVTVGDFASVYIDGATTAVYIGRVTAVAAGVNGAITVSSTAKSGTAPANSATGRSIKVAGAWKGPNAAENFPFGFAAGTMTDAAGDAPRVNFKNDATYSITAAMTHNVNGNIRFQGYTAAFGDLGRATIDGGTSGASYILLSTTANHIGIFDLIFQNNGATGSADGLSIGGNYYHVERCVFNNIRGNGKSYSGTDSIFEELEAYSCNQSNTANFAGFTASGNGTVYRRCISHDNAGSNASGFRMNVNHIVNYIECIAETNGSHGLNANGSSPSLTRCDFYNNGGSGVSSNGAEVLVDSCNFIKNTAWGIIVTGSPFGYIRNCGFGSGAQANGSGTTSGTLSIEVSGSITYDSGATPWVDPANGDFRINLAAAKGTGRGAFTQTAASYAGTIAYPDIGAAQSAPPPIGKPVLIRSIGTY